MNMGHIYVASLSCTWGSSEGFNLMLCWIFMLTKETNIFLIVGRELCHRSSALLNFTLLGLGEMVLE